ncbi:hypothetical protein [Actinophytocola sp. KF-1]
MSPNDFGENSTVDGLPDDEVFRELLDLVAREPPGRAARLPPAGHPGRAGAPAVAPIHLAAAVAGLGLPGPHQAAGEPGPHSPWPVPSPPRPRRGNRRDGAALICSAQFPTGDPVLDL